MPSENENKDKSIDYLQVSTEGYIGRNERQLGTDASRTGAPLTLTQTSNFSHALWGGRMVNHPHREPTALSYLLPLTNTPRCKCQLTRRPLCLPSVTLPHHLNHPNPLPQAIPNQPPCFYTPVDHSVDRQD